MTAYGAPAVTSDPADITAAELNVLRGILSALQGANANSSAAYAPVSASGAGATTIVAGVAGKSIRVLALQLIGAGAVGVKWQSLESTTDLTGLEAIAQNSGYVLPYNPVGWFQTNQGEGLDINLSGAVAVGGSLTYILI